MKREYGRGTGSIAGTFARPNFALYTRNAIKVRTNICQSYAKARAGDRTGFFVAKERAGKSDAISEGSKRQAAGAGRAIVQACVRAGLEAEDVLI